VFNPDQRDTEGDGLGDACDPCTDTDGDGFANPGFPASACSVDNCPTVVNPEQTDTDADATGDACDPCTDSDGDSFGDPGIPASTCRADNCAFVANPSQLDADGNGIGDFCECTARKPGRCVTGGADRTADCLVEFNTPGPVTLNVRRTRVKRTLRCEDGNPLCDQDGAADGQCTFGVSVCLGNSDPRLPRCVPSPVSAFEVQRPSPSAAPSTLDRDNALRLEQVLNALGVGIRRGVTTARAAALTLPGPNTCSPLVELAVPAPTNRRQKPVTRKFRVAGHTVDGRLDSDNLVLRCDAAR
jgi:hypothetical protein